LIGVEFTWKSFSGILGLYKFSGEVWKLPPSRIWKLDKFSRGIWKFPSQRILELNKFSGKKFLPPRILESIRFSGGIWQFPLPRIWEFSFSRRKTENLLLDWNFYFIFYFFL